MGATISFLATREAREGRTAGGEAGGHAHQTEKPNTDYRNKARCDNSRPRANGRRGRLASARCGPSSTTRPDLPRPPVDARQRLAFAQRFGGVDLKRFFAAVPGYPMIAEVPTVPEQHRRPDLIKPQIRSA